MKRFAIFLLSYVLILALTACGQEQPPEEPQVIETPVIEPSPEPTPADIIEEEITGEEEDHPWIEDDSPEFSYTHNEEIVAALTPDDAVIHSDIESMLVLASRMSMDEFIAFCIAAVEELGATEISIDDSGAGFWIYDGSLDDDIHLHIELRDDGDSINMMVLY